MLKIIKEEPYKNSGYHILVWYRLGLRAGFWGIPSASPGLVFHSRNIPESHCYSVQDGEQTCIDSLLKSDLRDREIYSLPLQ